MENRIRFIHISDTHILKSYDSELWHILIKEGLIDPRKNLEDTLKSAFHKYKNLDFILFTGDLVHEGSVSDYVYLKDMLQTIIGDVPVYAVPGNHDEKGPFREVFAENTTAPSNSIYSLNYFNGYRIITLDSAVFRETKGILDTSQLEWLKSILKEKAENGSILIIHHPPTGNFQRGMFVHSLSNSEELRKILSPGDVRAIFAGHVHLNASFLFGNIPAFTSVGTAFGVDISRGALYYLQQSGFNYCEMTINDIFVDYCQIPESKTVFRKDL